MIGTAGLALSGTTPQACSVSVRSASSATCPDPASCRATSAATGLLMEPAWNRVAGVTGVPPVRAVVPQAAAQAMLSPSTTAMLTPGTRWCAMRSARVTPPIESPARVTALPSRPVMRAMRSDTGGTTVSGARASGGVRHGPSGRSSWPPRTTATMRCVLRMSLAGSAARSTRSASMPGATCPRESAAPSTRAAVPVAARIASSGVRPALSTSSCSSACRFGVEPPRASVPATIGTPSRCASRVARQANWNNSRMRARSAGVPVESAAALAMTVRVGSRATPASAMRRSSATIAGSSGTVRERSWLRRSRQSGPPVRPLESAAHTSWSAWASEARPDDTATAGLEGPIEA